MTQARTRAFIGLGANLGGDLRKALETALRAIDALPETSLLAVSSAYRSAPVESSGPDYLNAVACVETALAPQALLQALLNIEAAQGRDRPYRNAPRTLDLDLLSFGDLQLETSMLTLPHPRLHLRAFVLLPLLELAPDLVLPSLGRLADALPKVRDQVLERQDVPLAWR